MGLLALRASALALLGGTTYVAIATKKWRSKTMAAALEYETFLRKAFGLHSGGMTDRWGDPAGLATTDVFNDRNIPSVKSSVSYAMEIFNQKILNDNHPNGDDEINRLEGYTQQVLSASSINDILELIRSYKSTVLEKYDL